MDPMVVVLTTLPAGADAAAFARSLVEERLVACVNTVPHVQSTYWWQGAVQEDREQLLIMKTTGARVEELETRIRRIHPYEVPEFVVLPVASAGEAYLRWVSLAVSPE